MDPCRKARIQTAIARGLATIATGVVAWFAALPIAQHFEYTLTDTYRIGIGFAFALVALFVSKRALDFTEDCMIVPDATKAAPANSVVSCRKPGCRHIGEGAPDGKTASDSGAAKNALTGHSNPLSGKTAVTRGPVSIEYHAEEGGITLVTVTVTGITAAAFKCKNGLRAKLEKVGHIKWEHPKNLGNNSRQMIGRISDANKREQVLAALQAIAGSR